MKYTDIKGMNKAELTKKREALVAEFFQAKMKNTLGQLSNPVQIRYLRKDIARVNTALAGQQA